MQLVSELPPLVREVHPIANMGLKDALLQNMRLVAKVSYNTIFFDDRTGLLMRGSLAKFIMLN